VDGVFFWSGIHSRLPNRMWNGGPISNRPFWGDFGAFFLSGTAVLDGTGVPMPRPAVSFLKKLMRKTVKGSSRSCWRTRLRPGSGHDGGDITFPAASKDGVDQYPSICAGPVQAGPSSTSNTEHGYLKTWAAAILCPIVQEVAPGHLIACEIPAINKSAPY